MTTRRGFLKSAAAVPLVRKLGAEGKTAPPPAMACTGEFRDLPAGWARYTNWQINAPHWPEISEHGGYLWVSAADLLAARLARPQMIHGLGYCACVEHEDDVERINREWWADKRPMSTDGKVRNWCLPVEVCFCDCEPDYVMHLEYCEIGMFLHPDDWPLRVHGAG
jgi:hypothetical protein